MYSYKDVMSLIPKRISDEYSDFDDPGYDRGLHAAASDYIVELLDEVKRLNALTEKLIAELANDSISKPQP